MIFSDSTCGQRPPITLLLFVLLTLLPTAGLTAQQVRVQAVVDKQQVTVGEPFTLQIQVEGSDQAGRPAVDSLTDFSVTFQGGQQNNSTSMTIINGRVNRVSLHGYVFSYQLTARRSGRLTIPPLTVSVDGDQYQTAAITIIAREPEKNDNFILQLTAEKNTVYVGEPVVLHLNWYIGQDVRQFSFSLPFITDSRLTIEPLDRKVPPGQEDNYLRIPLADKEVIAAKENRRYRGRNFLTVSFDLLCIANRAGAITLERPTVSAQVLTATERDPFDRFFRGDPFADFFGDHIRNRRATVVTPGNPLTLTARPLPTANRPASFTGLIGDYSIFTKATPTTVNVGDPITLTVGITGPEYLANVHLPDLTAQPGFATNFKIPAEMAPGVLENHQMLFTQTIRPTNARVTEIPPVAFSFFNSTTGRYQTVYSKAIPLHVNETRVVTARDAQGLQLTDQPAAGKTLSSVRGGITSNYADPDILEATPPFRPYWHLTTGWLCLLLLPPLLTATLALLLVARGYHKTHQGKRSARRALADFGKNIRHLDSQQGYQQLLMAMRRYFCQRFLLTSASPTLDDILPRLQQAGLQDAAQQRLERLFAACEAGHYGAGGAATANLTELRNEALELFKIIDALTD